MGFGVKVSGLSLNMWGACSTVEIVLSLNHAASGRCTALHQTVNSG